MKQTNWYVITGAPSSGKTTVLNALSELGYHIIPEVARSIIDEEIAKGKALEEIRKDEGEFQKNILKKKIEAEKNLNPKEVVFFDVGIPESIAYYKISGVNHREVLKLCNEHRYKKIFFLERFDLEKDYARVESDKTVENLDYLIRKAYSDLGYKIINIPKTSVENRVKIVLRHIEE